ncbi:MAG: DUF4956 domain-containing protein [Bacteroidales bacterium]
MIENFTGYNSLSVWGIMMRFGVNLFFLFILIRFVYFKYSKKEKFLFTFFLIGITIFFICAMLRKVEINIGIGLGLFAIFGILRFRTRNFSTKDMAYIFATIGLSVINSLSMIDFPFYGFIMINVVIVLSAFTLEEFLRKNSFSSHCIVYNDIDLLKPNSRNKLLKDLSNKTGLNILKIRVIKIDYKREIADLEVYFKEDKNFISA